MTISKMFFPNDYLKQNMKILCLKSDSFERVAFESCKQFKN